MESDFSENTFPSQPERNQGLLMGVFVCVIYAASGGIFGPNYFEVGWAKKLVFLGLSGPPTAASLARATAQ